MIVTPRRRPLGTTTVPDSCRSAFEAVRPSRTREQPEYEECATPSSSAGVSVAESEAFGLICDGSSFDDVEEESPSELERQVSRDSNCSSGSDSVGQNAPLVGSESRRSGLFRLLQGQGSPPVVGIERSRSTRSAPNLATSASTVYENMTSTEQGEFRNCKHCGGLFAFIGLCHDVDAGEALRLSFCSGECHLSYVTLYHRTRRARRAIGSTRWG